MSYSTYLYPTATGYWTFEIPFLSQTFLHVHQRPAVIPAAKTTSSNMNVIGQLMDKAKRAVVMQTVTHDKSPVAKASSPIRIVTLEAHIETRPTLIDEKSSAVLKYRTPHFRATATIKFPPLADGEHWKIGWIQACTRMDFFNTYGDCGYSSWEFPQLISGENSMISDADGRNYPFYGSKSELIELRGPSAEYRTVQVLMNDNFYPHITWDIPTSNERLSRLTNVKRHQTFYTWLVAMNAKTGSILVLKTISWQMNLEINVDPGKPQGSRATLISDPLPIQPQILKENVRIPPSVLYPPNANSAQILVWHPDCRLGQSSPHPEIVVPPRCLSILDQNSYYKHYLRHKTHTSIQNKLNSGSSTDQSSQNSDSSTDKSYTRLIFPPSGTSGKSDVQHYDDVKHMLEDHAKLAQGNSTGTDLMDWKDSFYLEQSQFPRIPVNAWKQIIEAYQLEIREDSDRCS